MTCSYRLFGFWTQKPMWVDADAETLSLSLSLCLAGWVGVRWAAPNERTHSADTNN